MGWLRLLAAGYLLGALGAWALLYFGGDRWWLATVLLFGPRWVLALPLLWLLPLGLIADRRILPWLALAAVVVAWPVMGLSITLTKPAAGAARDLRLLTYNIGSEYGAPAPELADVWRLVRIAQPDVVTLQECTISADELVVMFPGYHANGNASTCFLSRFPIVAVDARDRQDVQAMRGSGIIDRFEIATPKGIVSVLNLHLETVRKGLERVVARSDGATSAMRYSVAERRVESQLAREWATRARVPQLIAGDFNIPADSAIFRSYWGDFTDAYSRCGMGYGYTKMTKWFGIRIDHVLFDSRWECLEVTVDKSMPAGDHRPLIVDLRMR